MLLNNGVATSLPHVCVVGAGMAGLRCAEVLLNHGIKVTIIEARKRIGGRIWQSHELGYSLDMGPNWIYASSKDQAIMKLAWQTNTPLHLWNDDVRLFDSDGSLIDRNRSLRLNETIWGFFEESFGYSTEHGAEIPTSASLYQYVRKRIAECDVPEDDRELLVQLSQMWGNYTGSPIQRQSLKYVWTEIVCAGDEYFITTDFSAILSNAAKVPLEKANLLLGTKLTGLRSCSPQKCKTRIEIEIEGGNPLHFDAVVVTVPLGWLKRKKHIFQPALSPELVSSIEAISVGHLEKVYVTFPKAFWRSKNQNQDHPLDHTIWLSPKYARNTNPFRWPLECYDLAAFDPEHSHPTLLLYTFGGLSAHISSIVHENPDKDAQYALLDEYFQPYYSLLPKYDSNDPNCRPRAYLASKWRYDELAGYGSYCNMPVGIDAADGHIQRLQEGMPERGIWFAGEHAAPIEERGTVGGAWLSGEMAAEKVIAKYLSH